MSVLAIILALLCLLLTGPAIVYIYLTFRVFRANQALITEQLNDLTSKYRAPDADRLASLETKVNSLLLRRP